MRRRGVKIIGGLIVLGGCVAAIVRATWPESPPIPDWSSEYNTAPSPNTAESTQPGAFSDYDLVARPPDLIPPGTVIGQSAPPGWSHLVIKSLPRVRQDQRAGLPALTVQKAGWMFTAFLADVVANGEGGPNRYRLRTVALGLGTSVKGQDMILTAESGPRFHADLGWIGREILTKGYEVQAKALLVVHGPSLGLLDTPVWFRCGNANRLVRYRYALLPNAQAGRLDVLAWRLGDDSGGCNGLEELVLVAPNTIDEAELVVDRRKVNTFGIPSDDAFAVDTMPPGRRLSFPPDLRTLASRKRFSVDEVRTLETRLRQFLANLSPNP